MLQRLTAKLNDPKIYEYVDDMPDAHGRPAETGTVVLLVLLGIISFVTAAIIYSFVPAVPTRVVAVPKPASSSSSTDQISTAQTTPKVTVVRPDYSHTRGGRLAKRFIIVGWMFLFSALMAAAPMEGKMVVGGMATVLLAFITTAVICG